MLLLERRRISGRRVAGGMEEKACGGGQRGSRLAASRWAGGARPGLVAAQRTSSRAGARDRGRGAGGESESVTWGNSRRGPNAGHGVRDVVSGSSCHRPRSVLWQSSLMHPCTHACIVSSQCPPHSTSELLLESPWPSQLSHAPRPARTCAARPAASAPPPHAVHHPRRSRVTPCTPLPTAPHAHPCSTPKATSNRPPRVSAAPPHPHRLDPDRTP